MNRTCLRIEIELNASADAWLAACESVVDTMRALQGLEWKLWLLDAEKGTAGGVYLFRDAEAADAYARGPIVARLRASSLVKSVRLTTTPIIESLSARTFALPRRETGADSRRGENRVA